MHEIAVQCVHKTYAGVDVSNHDSYIVPVLLFLLLQVYIW